MRVAGVGHPSVTPATGPIAARLQSFARLRPYTLHVALAIYLPALLVADRLAGDVRFHHLLGVLTFAMLVVATRSSPQWERQCVWLAVGFWLLIEILGSLIWGIYEYRRSNLPLFVPFGHGLIYLVALRTMRSPLPPRARTALKRGTIVAASGWAIAGVTVLPYLTGHVDLAGASLLPIFVWGMLRSRRATFYATVFVVTSLLEIAGTSLGAWSWAVTQPWTGIPQGNPPSVVAGAYCIWDAVLRRLRPGLHVLEDE